MPLKTKRIAMVRGDTRKIQLQILNPYTGAVVNPTGAKLWFTAKRNVSDSDTDAIFQKTETNGISIVTASTGIIDVQIEPSDTAALSAVNHTLFYDAQIRTAAGEVLTFQSGPLLVAVEATRATS